MAENVFSIIAPKIRYMNISDFAFRLYAEIYALDYSGKYQYTNKELSERTKKSIPTISRAIRELKQHNLIWFGSDKNNRSIFIAKDLIIEGKNETKYDPARIDALRGFFENW